jgi:hypothetical protein
MFSIFKKKEIESEIEHFCMHYGRKWPNAAVTCQENLHEFIKRFNVKKAKDITAEMIGLYERQIFNESTSYFSLEAGKAVRNFANYWGVTVHKPELDVLTGRYKIKSMNEEKQKLLKELMSELGKKSWEARKKKYGEKKAIAILDRASKLPRKRLSTVDPS